jgi:hypothetical protein
MKKIALCLILMCVAAGVHATPGTLLFIGAQNSGKTMADRYNPSPWAVNGGTYVTLVDAFLRQYQGNPPFTINRAVAWSSSYTYDFQMSGATFHSLGYWDQYMMGAYGALNGPSRAAPWPTSNLKSVIIDITNDCFRNTCTGQQQQAVFDAVQAVINGESPYGRKTVVINYPYSGVSGQNTTFTNAFNTHVWTGNYCVADIYQNVTTDSSGVVFTTASMNTAAARLKNTLTSYGLN